jgi:hypothetical protein
MRRKILKAKGIYAIKIAPSKWDFFIQFSSNFIPNEDELKEIIEDINVKEEYPENFINDCLSGIKAWGIPKECKREIFRHWKYPGDYDSKGYLGIKIVNIYFK